GMHLCDLMGMEVRGMPISALFEVSARPALSEHLEAVFSTPEVVEFGVIAEGGARSEALSGQMILLPLLDSAGLGTHALGCIDVEGTIGQHPRRLLITGTRRQAILRPVSDIARRMGFAEAVASYQTPAASARPQLRLVKSDG
ncbi:MAG: PAS domain-containing protein, partial [Paracoccaceae bacterium]|nr:PAS domain-containing protein [Paracoccaceae bacterium]